MIRFECDNCGQELAVPDSKAGTAGTCPSCKKRCRVPEDPEAEEVVQQRTSARPKSTEYGIAIDEDAETSDPSSSEPETESGVMIEFSRPGLLKALVWLLSLQFIGFLFMVGFTIGCVVLVLKVPVSFKMILVLVMAGLLAVAGFCYFWAALANWRLFFFSTIPSSSCYMVESDRLRRYSRKDDEVVEEIPFANIASVRFLTRRNVENPEITAKVIGIDLRNPNAHGTTLDRQFFRWSQNIHHHDLVLIDDFFDIPLKTVFKKIKNRWQRWQETHPAKAADAEGPSPRRARQPTAWYLKWQTYVLGGVGAAVLGGLVLLVILLMPGKGDDQGSVPGLVAGPAPGPGPVADPPQGNPPASQGVWPEGSAGPGRLLAVG